ncbi:MAG: polysaccharide deacetylase family protein [Tepidisphaeraceae bacterium]|jgi:peptidoglycan/xylan/chitin deacetylase (PgdA/CDA1 family)
MIGIGTTFAIAAAGAAGSTALYGTFAPTSSLWGKVVWRAPDRSTPRVSVTFDDGPTPGCTDRVLDLLDVLGVKATFFVIGRNVQRCPDLLRRMDREGHLIANHSFDHGHYDMFRGLTYWNRQVSRTDELIESIIGKKPALFRPAMGFTTFPIHHAARRGGHTVVTWSRRGRDGVHADASDIVRRIMRYGGPGDILMLHDGIDPHLARVRDRSATIDAIRPLVKALRERGLSAVRLDELLGIAGYSEPAAPCGRALPAASVARTMK